MEKKSQDTKIKLGTINPVVTGLSSKSHFQGGVGGNLSVKLKMGACGFNAAPLQKKKKVLEMKTKKPPISNFNFWACISLH